MADCAKCGSQFKVTSRRQKFCSQHCARTATRPAQSKTDRERQDVETKHVWTPEEVFVSKLIPGLKWNQIEQLGMFLRILKDAGHFRLIPEIETKEQK
jgi:hypothetical protein